MLALATASSCAALPEEQPTAPTTSSCITIGTPPPKTMNRPWLEAWMPNASPPGPAIFAYSEVGLRVQAEVKALLMAMSMPVILAASIRSNAIKWPPPSTTAMSMSTPISLAFSLAASRMTRAPSSVRKGRVEKERVLACCSSFFVVVGLFLGLSSVS